MNRKLPLVAFVAALLLLALVPAAAHAQTVADAGFAPVTPGPDAAAATAEADGCSGKMINAPCSLGAGAGAGGFCFPDGVDGSESDLECVVDGGGESSGCNLAASASSAASVGALAAFLGLVLGGTSRARRRRRS